MKVVHMVGQPPYYTNSFVVISEGGHAAVIDPAAAVEEYTRVLQKEGATLAYILLTHGHFDHTVNAAQLRQKTGASLYLDSADAVGNHYYPLSADVVDGGYTHGGKIQLDELSFTTWHTPGHTPGSWCLKCEEFLFSGDTLFSGSIGRTDLPGGDMAEMNRSLKLLAELPLPDDTRVLPGHNDLSTMGQEKKYNYYLRHFAAE